MKKYRKIITFVIASIMVFSTTSCSKTAVEPADLTIGVQAELKVVEINDVDDLNKGLNIACQIGTTGEDWLNKNITSSSISKYNSSDNIVLNLIYGHVDAVIVDEVYANYVAREYDEIQINHLKFTTEEYAFAFRKDDEERRLAVDETIRKYKNDGTIQSLKDIYMPTEGAVSLPEKLEYNYDYDDILKVGISPDFVPFAYYDYGTVYGFDIDLVEMIAEDNKWGIEFVEMQFNELIPALQNGDIDMIAAAMSISEERYEDVDFSLGYFETEQAIITRK